MQLGIEDWRDERRGSEADGVGGLKLVMQWMAFAQSQNLNLNQGGIEQRQSPCRCERRILESTRSRAERQQGEAGVGQLSAGSGWS